MNYNKVHIEKNSYELFLITVLAKERFLTASELVPLLNEKFAITLENARKILQRAVVRGYIKSSKPTTFGRGQFVYFSNHEILSKDVIKTISKKYRPPLYRLIEALDINEGIVSYYEALKICAAPSEKKTSKVNSLDDLLGLLLKLNICYLQVDERAVKYIIYESAVQGDNLTLQREDSERSLMNQHFSKMALDCMFIPDFLRWLKKINLIDTLKTVYRNKATPSRGAEHNGLVWDAFAYTKVTGINPLTGKKADSIDKQTLIVLDVVVNREYNQIDIDGFLARIQLNINSVKTGVRKVMPIVVYKSISSKVLNTLSSLGFLSFDIGIVFGSKIYEVVDKLKLLQLQQLIIDKEDSDEAISKMLTTIRTTGQEENLNDIKGVLFEFLLYPVLKSIYSDAEIIPGKVLRSKKQGDTEKHEFDYIIKSSNPKEIIIIELKGYSSSASISLGDDKTKNTLRWFFRKTLPFAQTNFKEEISNGYRFRGCFITSAKFFEDGTRFLEKINLGSTKPQKMNCYYDGSSLLQLLQDYDFNKIKMTIERFYMKKDDKLT